MRSGATGPSGGSTRARGAAEVEAAALATGGAKGGTAAAFKADDGTWYGFAARARILLVNTSIVSEADRPRGIRDLLDPKWKGRIGIAKPLSVYVETDGTAKVDEDRLSRVLQELMHLSPRGIRTHLGLNKPIYARTAAYGHFGRAPEPDGGFSWERLDLVDELRRAF